MGHGPHDPVQRVNDKHGDELLAVAQILGGHADATAARAMHVDTQGIDLLLSTPDGPVAARISFPEPVSDPRRMRASFRALTRRAQAVLAAEDQKER